MKATSQLLLYKTRAKSNGKFPVKLRVIYLREKHDYKVGLDLTESEFEEAIKPKPLKHYRDYAAVITSLQNKANKIIDELPIFTFTKFENELYGNLKSSSDLFVHFEEYIEELKNQDRYKTASAYQTALNAFKKFNGKSKLNVYDITPQFLTKFSKWMNEQGNSPTSVGIYTRTLRAIYNYIITKGVIKRDENYPFGRTKFTIPASRNVKKALSLEEIKLIYEYEPVPYSFEDKSKDFWMFSYFCNGINFTDIAQLKRKNIDGDMLRFVREKTKRTTQGNQVAINCYLNDHILAIIKKWENKDQSPDAYLFPILESNDSPQVIIDKVAQFIQTTNKNIKRICAKVGIEKKVTTYYGRHSAATILKKSGASIEQIQELLGHTSSNTTRAYLDSFDDDTKKSLSTLLIPLK